MNRLATHKNIQEFYVFVGQEACVCLPDKVCRGAAGPSTLVHQYISASTQGPQSADQSQCPEGPVQYPCPHDLPHHDASHQRGCDGHVTVCQKDGSSCHPKALQVLLNTL